MRIGFVGRCEIQLPEQAGHRVGMQVEAGNDGHVGSDDGAQRRQQVGFGAVQPHGLHAAVQAQRDCIEAAGSRPVQDTFAQQGVGAVLHPPAGPGARSQRGNGLAAMRLQCAQDAAQHRIGRGVGGQHGPAAFDLESRQGRVHGGESVRLLE